MIDIVLSLVFSAPLLLLAIYPAIKIVEYIEQKIKLKQKTADRLTIMITILLAIVSGALLHFT